MIRHRTLLLALVVTAFACVSTVTAGPDAKLEQLEEQAFKQAAALVEPSVVRIQTVGGLDKVGKVLLGTGPTTGVAVGKDGYIISSSFNFLSKPASILVELSDGRRLAANIVATDRSRMLTLLKIEANDLVPAVPASKSTIKVGHWSIALGRTYANAQPSVSVGIISALNRVWGKAIQTDAKVSPVNYGGPIVDIEGRVQGILVAMSPQGNDETAGVEWYDGGIGFAVPMEDVYVSVERLKKGEDLRPGLLGIEFGGKDKLAGEALIDRVRIESPADKAGLKSGDRITEVDGKPIIRQTEVQMALGNRYAGDKVAIAVKRKEEVIKQEVTLVAELTAYESGYLGVLPARPAAEGAAKSGIAVRHLFADSPAAKSGLRAKDLITQVNGKEVADTEALRDVVSRLRPKEKIDLTFARDGKPQTVQIELGSIPNEVVKDLPSALIPPGNNPDAVKQDEVENKKGDDPAEADGPNTKVILGRFTETTANKEHSYWAYVPEEYNANFKYGLMVFVHSSDDTMEAAIFRQWKSICDQRGLILLAPKAAKLGGWQLDEAEFVKETVEQFQTRYSIDPARVFLHGFSSGGTFAWHLVFKHRETFRGAAIAGQPLLQRPPENAPSYRQQFHLTCGAKDPLAAQVQATVKGLQTLKFPCSITLEPDREAKYPSAEQVQEIARWADSLDRI